MGCEEANCLNSGFVILRGLDMQFSTVIIVRLFMKHSILRNTFILNRQFKQLHKNKSEEMFSFMCKRLNGPFVKPKNLKLLCCADLFEGEGGEYKVQDRLV